MNEQTIKVYIKHNMSLQPIVDATVYWTEHLTNPNDEENYKPEYSKSGVSTTNKNGIATIVIDIHESVRDGFNIPFVYYKKIWVSVDTVKCNGFKDSILKKVFPAIGEEQEDIKNASEYKLTAYLVPES